VGHLHLQYHDGDDDGDHAVTERFKPILSHAESTPAQRNFRFTNMATADGIKTINRKIGNSSGNEYPACDTPIHMFAAAATNQVTTNATVAVIIDEVFDLAEALHLQDTLPTEQSPQQ
jgi:hypothetical protein